MSRGVFGWSYPPGCSGPPEYPEPDQLSLDVDEMIEKDGRLSQEAKDRVVRLLEEELGALRQVDEPPIPGPEEER